MKSIVRILGSLVGIGIISLLWWIFVKWDGCGKKKIERKEAKAKVVDEVQIRNIQDEIQDTTVHYSKNGLSHSSSTVVNGDRKQLTIFLQHKLDSACKEIGIRNEQIAGLKSELVNAHGEIESHIEQVADGLYEVPFDDCFLHGYSIINLVDRTQEMKYNSNIKLHSIIYWHHKHNFLFIHWGSMLIKEDSWTDCPNVEIDSIQDIQIRKD